MLNFYVKDYQNCVILQMISYLKIVLFSLLILTALGRWTDQQAWNWYKKYQWSAGFNYIPAYAVNQIQMWESFNIDKINTQLGWAKDIGFSKLRVFLHIQPFIDNKDAFLRNISIFTRAAFSKGHSIIFVLFDDCWKPTYHAGVQPNPIPGIHNSQWVQCPGTMNISQQLLKTYTQTILRTFGNDSSIAMWDLYNQAGNQGHFEIRLPLLKKIFQWARQVNPIQPLTSCIWKQGIQFEALNKFHQQSSDIMTFHAYCDVSCTQKHIEKMKKFGRPVICTQYMARELDSKFITHLPVFKRENIWAINWGFVFGRTQTYYPWWSVKGSPVPKVWFHDVVHPDGSPFDKAETTFIRNITYSLPDSFQ